MTKMSITTEGNLFLIGSLAIGIYTGQRQQAVEVGAAETLLGAPGSNNKKLVYIIYAIKMRIKFVDY